MSHERRSQWGVLRRCIAMARIMLFGEASREELLRIVDEEAGGNLPRASLLKRFEEDRRRLRYILNCTISVDRVTGMYAMTDAGELEGFRQVIKIHMPSELDTTRMRTLGYEMALREAEFDWFGVGIYAPEIFGVPTGSEQYLALRSAFHQGARDAGGLFVFRLSRIYPGRRCPNCGKAKPKSDRYFYRTSRDDGSLQGICKKCYKRPLEMAAGASLVLYSRRRYHSDPHRNAIASENWKKRHPEKVKAEGRAVLKRRVLGLLTLRGAAMLSSIPVYYLEKQIERGEIPAQEIEGKTYIVRDKFEAWLDKPQVQTIRQQFRKLDGRE